MKNCFVCGSKCKILEGNLASISNFSIVECETCQLLSLEPMPSSEEIHKYFTSNHIKHFSEEFLDSNGAPTAAYFQYVAPLKRRRLNIIQKYSKGKNVLQIGSSFGFLLSLLKKKGFSVQGIEPGFNFISYTKSLDIPVAKGFFEIEADKFPNNYYNVIIVSHILHMIRDPLQILEKAIKKLAKNGIIYIEVPNTKYYYLKNRKRQAKTDDVNFHFQDNHLYYFSPKAFERIAERLRLEIILLKTPKRRLKGTVYKFKSIFYKLLNFSETFILMDYGDDIICVVRKS